MNNLRADFISGTNIISFRECDFFCDMNIDFHAKKIVVKIRGEKKKEEHPFCISYDIIPEAEYFEIDYPYILLFLNGKAVHLNGLGYEFIIPVSGGYYTLDENDSVIYTTKK